MSDIKDTTTEEESSKPFTERGKCLDEARLVFDDEQELYVSQNFLILSSPVFEAMFKNDFKEKQSRTVELTGKNYEDFLEFLMCIHPGIQTPITESNVLRVVHIAEEYQVASIIKTCRSKMTNWLNKEVKMAKDSYDTHDRVVPTRHCLNILTTALSLNYETLTDYAVGIIARLPHRIYYGSYKPDILETQNSINLNNKKTVNGIEVTVKDIIAECRQLFLKLPSELRCKLLSKRLTHYSRDEVI